MKFGHGLLLCHIAMCAGEIDRCLKKVQEGVEAFEEIWKKVLSHQHYYESMN